MACGRGGGGGRRNLGGFTVFLAPKRGLYSLQGTLKRRGGGGSNIIYNNFDLVEYLSEIPLKYCKSSYKACCKKIQTLECVCSVIFGVRVYVLPCAYIMNVHIGSL